jgi:ribosomal protein L11 methyltransferase
VIRLAVSVRREHAELVLAELLELAPSGVEEAEVGDGVVEYAVYGSPGELPQLPDVRAAAGEALVEVATSELPDDWGERWKRFHRPVLIERPARRLSGKLIPGLHVRPPWEPACDRAEVEEIVIDPGQAFGTGAHATTRMCLELLLELAAEQCVRGPLPAGESDPLLAGRRNPLRAGERGPLLAGERGPLRAGERGPLLAGERGPLLDIGTGSGVLAIAAARLGFGPIVGLDNEQESVQAARENALANGVEVEVRRFDLRHEPLPLVDGAAASTVLANLLRPLLLDLAQSLRNAPTNLIAGGLLTTQADELVGVFKKCLNMHERQRRTSGEWAAVWLAAADARADP